MGGKVWSSAEERHFWRYCMPRSHKRVARDWEKYHKMTPEERRAKHYEIMEWTQIAEEMMRWATKDGGAARLEHFYLNVHVNGRTRSPYIEGMALPYIKQLNEDKKHGKVNNVGDPTGHRFEPKTKVKSESEEDKKPAVGRKAPRASAVERRGKKMTARRSRMQAEENEDKESDTENGDEKANQPVPKLESSIPQNNTSASGPGADVLPRASCLDADLSNQSAPLPSRQYGDEYGTMYSLDSRVYYPSHSSSHAQGHQQGHRHGHGYGGYSNHQLQQLPNQPRALEPPYQTSNYHYQYSNPYGQNQFTHQQLYNSYHDAQVANTRPRLYGQPIEPLRYNDTPTAQRGYSMSQHQAQSNDFTTGQAAAALVSFHQHAQQYPTSVDSTVEKAPIMATGSEEKA
ncbi:hypothetical protein QBC43DRAFT_284317 [Cladorrhinum sp. PSN259]|nr:hypothetical protein QBC43DRAFT_284317 [Cladorrhinum sp. PSN259]